VPTETRRRVIALTLSGVFPGLGQIYNHQLVKGAVFLTAGAVPTWLIGRVLPGSVDTLMALPLETNTLLLTCLLLVIWIWSCIDAWRAAGR
jgi:hypothetical protein